MFLPLWSVRAVPRRASLRARIRSRGWGLLLLPIAAAAGLMAGGAHGLIPAEFGLAVLAIVFAPKLAARLVPFGLLGLAFYVFAVAIMSPWAWRWARREVSIIRLAAMVIGIGFVLYLLYAELFIIGSICLYCTSVHAITFVLFLLTVIAVAAWGLPERQRS